MGRFHGGDMSLGQAIEQLLQVYKLKDKALHARLRESWPHLAGEYVAAKTKRLFVQKQTLYIEVEHSVLRQEIRYNKLLLLQRINEAIPGISLNELVLL